MLAINLMKAKFGERFLSEVLTWMYDRRGITIEIFEFPDRQDEHDFGKDFLESMKQWIEENT